MLRKLAEEKDRVLIWRNCRPCGGDGGLRRPHCALCGREAAAGDAWWQRDVGRIVFLVAGLLPLTFRAASATILSCSAAGRTPTIE